ncbi:IclR family transcriptional regulator [Arthrobacter castelli]|uniref:IclR family transcriptional regulator n=1 Tax=Arthrobacter castelli TaxID=271431 RepID=UPI000410D9F7|nr:IclR family transcriptional regulator [Arthrobacter castelli]
MSQSIQRAADILEFVSIRPRTPSEVAEHLQVHRSTALRMLQTLSETGLARRRNDGLYGVGYRLTGLAHVAQEQFDLAAVAKPHLAALGESCSHTIHLAELQGRSIAYVDKIEQPGMVRLYSQIGQPVVLHTSGVSKAILAHQSAAVVDAMLESCSFESYTDATITSPDAFRRELDHVRDQGWAVDAGEYEDYVNCIAMPLHDAGGAVFASASITSLKARADLDELQQLAPRLKEVTTSISKEIGWRP